jgi:hypothetical protein
VQTRAKHIARKYVHSCSWTRHDLWAGRYPKPGPTSTPPVLAPGHHVFRLLKEYRERIGGYGLIAAAAAALVALLIRGSAADVEEHPVSYTRIAPSPSRRCSQWLHCGQEVRGGVPGPAAWSKMRSPTVPAEWLMLGNRRRENCLALAYPHTTATVWTASNRSVQGGWAPRPGCRSSRAARAST